MVYLALQQAWPLTNPPDPLLPSTLPSRLPYRDVIVVVVLNASSETPHKKPLHRANRYAAPEVSMALPHGDRADVYSWALLAWSVASGRTPFEGIGRSAFYSRVVVSGCCCRVRCRRCRRRACRCACCFSGARSANQHWGGTELIVREWQT